MIIPDNGNGASTPNAARVKSLVQKCSGKDVPVFTYQSDINRAAEQTRVTVAGLINAKVTTVVCMCDAIAPVFLTNGMTQNSYFPEHLLPGANLLDYDVLGRLYDPPQWAHAFGPSQLTTPVAATSRATPPRSGGPPGTRACPAPAATSSPATGR